MKEYEKLLLENKKRLLTQKALMEVKLGLFEQKKEEKIDLSAYINVTYGRKYKGLYDLYENPQTQEILFICPLVENNKNDYNERKDLEPYAYDVLYLDYLDEKNYQIVKKAAMHERSTSIDFFYYFSFVFYSILLIVTLTTTIYYAITDQFINVMLLCSTLWGSFVVTSILFPILIIQYRKFKAQ